MLKWDHGLLGQVLDAQLQMLFDHRINHSMSKLNLLIGNCNFAKGLFLLFRKSGMYERYKVLRNMNMRVVMHFAR